MKRNCLKLFLIAAITQLVPEPCYSQSVVQYTYDNAGNRLSQCVLSNRHGDTFGHHQDDSQGRITNGQLADHNIRITVFESQGLVKVEVLGFSDSDECQLSVFSTSGILVATDTAGVMPVTIDISQCRKGIYILQVILNGETGSWKFIRR